ncbi:unnamed protein product [Brassicogethes aeneus]|uniref:Regulatory protein zeste n=1 Tax=Brassicogethes aeneus TaxID=1431903 RepID=A0A9P0B6A6_BRAAE|nr:unnamed protein product [Brassicogethes aeneus]
MESAQNRSKTIIPQQKNLLYSYMRRHPSLSMGKFSRNFTHKNAQRLWMELTETLNAVPGGSFKNWRQWRKLWQDLRCREKKMYRTSSNAFPEENTDIKVLVSPKLEPPDEEHPNGDIADSVSSTSTTRPMPPLYSSKQMASMSFNSPSTSQGPPPLTLIEPPRLIPLTNTKTVPKVVECPSNVNDNKEEKDSKEKYREELVAVKWAKVKALERIATALEVLVHSKVNLPEGIASALR